ncbi:glypican-5 [Anabrus simplex]|uniref:glypican-5 n=1 Tax=Anabrus simplex TaxID=316456 RepID=UPI0035A3CCF5
MRFVPVIVFWCLCFVLTLTSKPALANAVTTARTAENVTSCEGVKPIFEMKNVSSDIPDVPVSGTELRVCQSTSSCCTQEMEDNLRLLVRKDFQGLLHHNSRSLEGLLASTASRIQEHVSELARQSENRTLALFSQVYQQTASLLKEPVEALYADILRYLSADWSSTSPFTLGTGELSLEDSVASFFSRLFPLVYHRASPPHRRDFSEDYKSCLRATMGEVLPFGDIPRQLALSVGKTFEATRVLLQALALGVEVLNSTDALVLADECHVALLRMSYCGRCHGLAPAVRPCVGYCLNVLRGCLTQHAAELDLPWNGFVEATERLAVTVRERDVEHVVRGLHARITEAIMYTVENVAVIDKRVKRACGQARYSENSAVEPPSPPAEELAGVTVSQDAGDAALTTQLRLLLASLGRSRGFYANLAESLCSDDSFAETRDTADCWNGQRVGEYSKMVVSSSISAQKYNPELVWTQRTPDPKIAQMSDKLRHIRQVVLSQLTLAPESDSFMRDIEGSGSGHEPDRPRWTDDEDTEDSWVEEGSGSGDHSTDRQPTVKLASSTSRPVVFGGTVPTPTKTAEGASGSPRGSVFLLTVTIVCIRLVPALRNG